MTPQAATPVPPIPEELMPWVRRGEPVCYDEETGEWMIGDDLGDDVDALPDLPEAPLSLDRCPRGGLLVGGKQYTPGQLLPADWRDLGVSLPGELTQEAIASLDRRVRIFRIAPGAFVCDLPQDSRVVACAVEFDPHRLVLTVYHPDFEPVSDGEDVPPLYDSFDLDAQMATEPTRQVGEKWQGRSGRWFTKNEQGKVVPYAAPDGSHPSRRWPAQPEPTEGKTRAASEIPVPQKTLSPEEAVRREQAQQAPQDAQTATMGHDALSSPAGRQQAARSLAEAAPLRLERTDLLTGLNTSYFVHLDDGNRGVFKPAGGETEHSVDAQHAGIEPGTFWRREVAASQVAELLGFADLVPPTVERKIGRSTGSMQQFIGGATPGCDVPAEARFDGEGGAARAAAFDYLVGSLDRHGNNWLVTQDGKLVLIDNGLSFPRKYGEENFVHVQFRLHAATAGLRVPELRGLEEQWAEVEATLKRAGIEPDAIALTRVRMRMLAAHSGRPFSELPLLAKERGMQGVQRTQKG